MIPVARKLWHENRPRMPASLTLRWTIAHASVRLIGRSVSVPVLPFALLKRAPSLSLPSPAASM